MRMVEVIWGQRWVAVVGITQGHDCCWISWVGIKAPRCKCDLGGVADPQLCWGVGFNTPPVHFCPQRSVPFPLGTQLSLDQKSQPFYAELLQWLLGSSKYLGHCIPCCIGQHTPRCFSGCVFWVFGVYQFLPVCVAGSAKYRDVPLNWRSRQKVREAHSCQTHMNWENPLDKRQKRLQRPAECSWFRFSLPRNNCDLEKWEHARMSAFCIFH